MLSSDGCEKRGSVPKIPINTGGRVGSAGSNRPYHAHLRIRMQRYKKNRIFIHYIR